MPSSESPIPEPTISFDSESTETSELFSNCEVTPAVSELPESAVSFSEAAFAASVLSRLSFGLLEVSANAPIPRAKTKTMSIL